MKFGDFLLPVSRTPDNDFAVIDDALREAQLCEELGLDAVWLTEHHFSGGVAYVDPSTFGAAVAAGTTRITIGFAVAQMALHHPVRLAEQVALLDNLSRGRIILGIGRGTRGNFYEYRGFGIPSEEAHERLLEAEEILLHIWTTSNYKHQGKYWQLDLPVLRPQPYQKPHPPVVRGCVRLESVLDMARQGRPVLLSYHGNDTLRQYLDQYRQTMAETGYDEESIARNLENSWVLRNVVVAETDAEAQAIGLPAYDGWMEHAKGISSRLNTPIEKAFVKALRSGERGSRSTIICGSPATVCEELEELRKIGIGGLIIYFRVGPMSRDAAENSLRLFAQKVAPQFQVPVAG